MSSEEDASNTVMIDPQIVEKFKHELISQSRNNDERAAELIAFENHVAEI